MKIFTLTGKAGSGKSYSAMGLCEKYNIESIIDDGLFIFKGKVVEGLSAKRSQTKIGAVKIAIFYSEEIREKVRNAIKKENPESMLVIATSDKMADDIIEKLELKVDGEITRIKIEDIRSKEELELASHDRKIHGRHVIPAPSLEVKKRFSGYFVAPIFDRFSKDKSMSIERTVVRPAFSYMGDYILNPRVINDIIKISARKNRAVDHIIYITQDKAPESYKVSVILQMKKGYPLWESAVKFQNEIHEMIEKMTSFNLVEVNIEVRSVE